MGDRFSEYGHRLELVLGNIVNQRTDAIVNAANTKLAGGGGVDGAIHRAAGPALKSECEALPANERGKRCPTGDVRVTGAGNLEARWVIHSVGPFYSESYKDKCEAQLQSAYRRTIEEAARLSCRSVALPAISAGAYRFPLDAAARIAIRSTWSAIQSTEIEIVRFVLFKPRFLEAFRQALAELRERGNENGIEGRRTGSDH